MYDDTISCAAGAVGNGVGADQQQPADDGAAPPADNPPPPPPPNPDFANPVNAEGKILHRDKGFPTLGARRYSKGCEKSFDKKYSRIKLRFLLINDISKFSELFLGLQNAL